MPSTQQIQAQLEGFRESLIADGYDLTVDAITDGTAHLRISAGPDACAECLVPKRMMQPMIEAELSEVAALLLQHAPRSDLALDFLRCFGAPGQTLH